MIQFEDSIIEGKDFILDDKAEVYYFGHDLTLKGCRIVIKVPAKSLVFAKVRLIGCTLDIKRELKEFRWWSASLEGCRSSGRLTGCEFGSWPDIAEGGSIRDCDFTGAQLHWCRFTACDASTLNFPPWPCVTILDPVKRLDELRRRSWPGNAGLLVDTLADTRLATAALTLDAIRFAREHDTSAEAFKAALQGLPGIIS